MKTNMFKQKVMPQPMKGFKQSVYESQVSNGSGIVHEKPGTGDGIETWLNTTRFTGHMYLLAPFSNN